MEEKLNLPREIKYFVSVTNTKELFVSFLKSAYVELGVKNPPISAGHIRDVGLTGSGRSPGEGHVNLL